MDDTFVTPQAVVTLAYFLAALFSVAGSFAWLRFVHRRTTQSSAGNTPDLRGLSNAATTTALAMLCAGAAFIFSTFV
tara:strand:+ start:154 stop:384 length:231 start_codon:yes stop_codon:yes gene_type:complete